MHILRAIELSDLPQVMALAGSMRDGIASLPRDEFMMEKRLKHAVRSFKADPKTPGNQYYLFGLFNMKTSALMGLSGIYARAGGSNYFYTCERHKEIYSHEPLKIAKQVESLHFKKNSEPWSEVCSLYLNPRYRKSGLGPLLSQSRYLYIAAFRKRFMDSVLAELRGYRDKRGESPFWNAIGRHFFEIDLQTLDTMKSMGHKGILKSLTPRHPIYVNLLPKAARDVVGTVHKRTEPALRMLLKQGFSYSNWVDPLDAGPYMTAKLKDIKPYKNHKVAKYKASTKAKEEPGPYLVANRSQKFRACMSSLKKISKNEVALPENTAEALHLSKGDSISYVKL